MREIKQIKLVTVVAVVLLGCMVTAQAATRTWDNSDGGVFATAGNWIGDVAPVSGVDSAILVPSAGTSWFSSEFTIASGQSMTASDNADAALRIGAGGDLTVATGGTLDFSTSGANLAQNGSSNQRMTFEAGATVTLANMYTSTGWTMEFIANAGGMTKVDVGYFAPEGPLELDLTNYDTANGSALILFDYAGGSGVFSSTNVTGAPTNGVVNYAYDQGGSDMAIAYILDLPVVPYQWDGGGGDSEWSTAANWNYDEVPGVTDDVVVGTGYTVINVPDSYGSLLVETNASVTMEGAGNAWNGRATTVEGTLNFAGAFRLYGTLDLSGNLGGSMTYFIPYGTSTVHFRDGASLDNSGITIQLDDTPTLEFTLSETGFAMLQAGNLLNGNNISWSAVTFNIDISAYNRNNGIDIDLIDFTSHGDKYNAPFNPTITITGHKGGTLTFDQASHTLKLEVLPDAGTLVCIQ